MTTPFFLFFCSNLMSLSVSLSSLSASWTRSRGTSNQTASQPIEPLILGNILSLPFLFFFFYNTITSRLFFNSSSLHISRPCFISVSSGFSDMQAVLVDVGAVGTHAGMQKHTRQPCSHTPTRAIGRGCQGTEIHAENLSHPPTGQPDSE